MPKSYAWRSVGPKAPRSIRQRGEAEERTVYPAVDGHGAADLHRRAAGRVGDEYLGHAYGFERRHKHQARPIRRPGELEHVLVRVQHAADRDGAVGFEWIGHEHLELAINIRIG